MKMLSMALIASMLMVYGNARSIKNLKNKETRFYALPDDVFLNSTVGNIQLFQEHIIYDDKIKLDSKDLKIDFPQQIHDISNFSIRNALIAYANDEVREANKRLFNERRVKCQKFDHQKERIIGEILGGAALTLSIYTQTKVREQQSHLENLEQSLRILEGLHAAAIQELKVMQIINEAKNVIKSIIKDREDDMNHFYDSIFENFLHKPEMFPGSVHLKIRDQQEGTPDFYKINVIHCSPFQMHLNIISYYTQNPINAEVIEADPLGWFEKDQYVEPTNLCKEFIFTDDTWKCFDHKDCAFTYFPNATQKIECLDTAAYTMSRCTPSTPHKCNLLRENVTSNVIKWKLHGDVYEILTKVPHFYISGDNKRTEHHEVPANGKFLIKLNEQEKLTVGTIQLHGVSQGQTIMYQADLNINLTNIEHEIEKLKNYTDAVGAGLTNFDDVINNGTNSSSIFVEMLGDFGKTVGKFFSKIMDLLFNHFIFTIVLVSFILVAVAIIYLFVLRKCCCAVSF